MFEIYNVNSGNVVRKIKDFVKANEIAISYTETYAYINGDKFDFRPIVDTKPVKGTQTHGSNR
jgi:hypothetical protein